MHVQRGELELYMPDTGSAFDVINSDAMHTCYDGMSGLVVCRLHSR